MEESEYKSTYNALASVRCVFEKALTNNRAKCVLSRHFWLADREGYACKDMGQDISGWLIVKVMHVKIWGHQTNAANF